MYLAHRSAVSAAKVFTLCAPFTLTQQTARFLVNTPEVTKLRRHVRHAVARRERVEVAPAWLVSTEDVERPSTPELVRERGVVKPADSERVRRVRRASVIHQLAGARLVLHHNVVDGGEALPHREQPSPHVESERDPGWLDPNIFRLLLPDSCPSPRIFLVGRYCFCLE